MKSEKMLSIIKESNDLKKEKLVLIKRNSELNETFKALWNQLSTEQRRESEFMRKQFKEAERKFRAVLNRSIFNTEQPI